MNSLLILPLVVAFFVTFLVMPIWIRKARKMNLMWPDMNKYKNPRNVVGSGGIVAVTGFILSILVYIAIKTFYFHSNEKIMEIFALTTMILILTIIGLVDSLFGWGGGLVRDGLRRRYRMILCVFAAIPLMVINAGSSSINIPFFGLVNLGWIYPLILIPVGIVGASTTFNFLAGFNGLEASQGILLLAALSIIAYLTGSSWLALIGLCIIFALLAFLIFNWCPAKVLPGDVLTYPIGGLIAAMAILGNFERIAVFFFIPNIIEVVLKIRGRLKKQSFGKPDKDNKLDLAYDKVYSLNHIAIILLKKIKGEASEKEVVYVINIFQLIIILIGFLLFFGGVL